MTVQMGIYRHYKGPLYQVLGTAHDANADILYGVEDVTAVAEGSAFGGEPLGKRHVVVYIPLQLDGAHLGPRMAVRTIDNFEEQVCTAVTHYHYGEPLRLDGPGKGDTCKPHPRFEYVGSELTVDLLLEALKHKSVVPYVRESSRMISEYISCDTWDHLDTDEPGFRVNRSYDKIGSVVVQIRHEGRVVNARLSALEVRRMLEAQELT